MNDIFLKWVEDKRKQLDKEAIITDDINVANNNANPSVTVDHSSQHCLGRVSVWQTGLMDVEVLHIDTEKRLFFEHHQLDANANFDALLEKYIMVMTTGERVD